MSFWNKGDLISEIVTRDISLSERSSVPTLNDLPDFMVDEAKALARQSKHEAFRYLRFFVEAVDLAQADDFIRDVLLGQEGAKTWNVRDCLWVPSPVTSGRVLASPFWGSYALAKDDLLFQISPTSVQRPSDEYPGCVGILKHDRKYWETAPEGFDQYFFGAEDLLAEVSQADLPVKIRRWCARILSWKAREHLARPSAEVTADGLLSSLSGIDPATFTPDARRAARGLAREAHAFGTRPDFALRAGFLGPDDWYA